MRLSHTTIFVDDVARTARFYQEVLGLGPAVVDASGQHATLPGLVLMQHELAAVGVPVGYLAASAGAKTLGVMLSFSVEDLDAVYERALVRGGQKVAAPEDGVAFVRDCNGILLELVGAKR